MKQHSKNAEWEGFEHFHDITETNHTDLVDLDSARPKQKVLIAECSPTRILNRNKFALRKRSDSKKDSSEPPSPITPVDKPRRCERGVVLQSDEKLLIDQKKVALQPPKKYDRIPIIKYEEDCHYVGRVVYKGFVPRSSDNYFRMLRQLELQSSVVEPKKLLHKVQFNSQFEGGNLNLAVEGWRVRVRLVHACGLEHEWTPTVVLLLHAQPGKVHRQTPHIPIPEDVLPLPTRHATLHPQSQSRQLLVGCWRQCRLPSRKGSQQKLRPQKQQNYTFEHDADEVLISAGIPYTYTFLQKRLEGFKRTVEKKESLKFEVAVPGRSMCGLDMQVITIEHKMASLLHDTANKSFIVINARTHSGQASSSWVLDGLLQEICNSPLIQEWLLESNVCLKIVPMLNPDGVFIGNYRAGILGDDFNRKFNTGKKEYYPQITVLKNLVSSCKRQGSMQLFLDLHGHSILKNSFIYGPAEKDFESAKLHWLPRQLGTNSKYFREASCKYRTEKQCIETARVYFQLKEKILSFTCENSLGLYYQQKQTYQMFARDWKTFGQSIICSVRQIYEHKVYEMPRVISTIVPQTPKKIRILSKINQQASQGQSRPQVQRLPSSSKPPLKIPIISTTKSINMFGETTQKTLQTGKIEKLAEMFQKDKQGKIDQMEEIFAKKKESTLLHEGIHEKVKFKIRRKSEVIKIPVVTSKLLRRNKEDSLSADKQNSADLPLNDFSELRAETYDSAYLQKHLNHLGKTFKDLDGCKYEIEAIDENFSEEYSSMNDSDSEGEDLKVQEKHYILDYIKASRGKQEDNLQNSEEEEAEQTVFEAKINRFREIRFKSADQEVAREVFRNNLKKKMEPFKLREASRSLKQKYNELVSQDEFDDPAMVSISQQKKLYQRSSNLNKTLKDPYVLTHKKSKEGHSKEEDYILDDPKQ